MGAEAHSRKLFGTDGVRDVANAGNMTPEFALGLGAAFARFLAARGASGARVLVCRDTRRSGPMIESALAAGLMSEGASALELGIFPTPGVSFLLRHGGYDAGAVVSASHNPAEYNGIKFFDASGSKLSDADEAEIERVFFGGRGDRPAGAGVGTLEDASALRRKYTDWLAGRAAGIKDRSRPIVVDAANGAAAGIARELFASWGGAVRLCGVDYDGMNINRGVGVMHLDHLASEVRGAGAALGIAYDGDADRVLLCDGLGRPIDGDIMLWVIGRYLAREGALGTGVVATVMSNMALEERLAAEGIELFRCPVGDRYVLERMRETGSRLGGEQSGHIIASDHAGTGDGLCTGIFFLKACEELGIDPAGAADGFPRYPQTLRNLRVEDSRGVMASPRLAEACEAAEGRLAGAGRILIRPSGTEPLIRILVEARDEALMTETAEMLERTVASLTER